MALRRIGFFASDNPDDAILPHELLVEISSNFSPDTLLKKPDNPNNNLHLVSKQFARMLSSDDLWQKFFKKRFGVDIVGPGCKKKFQLHDDCETLLALARLPNQSVTTTIEATSAYMKLRYLADNPSDNIWTFYLRGLFQQSFPAICALFDGGETNPVAFLYKAAEQGNPLAMVYFAKNIPLFTEWLRSLMGPLSLEMLSGIIAFGFLTRAHDMGYLPGTLALAELYLKLFGSTNNLIHFNHFLLLTLEAAHKGLPEAAYQLVEHYILYDGKYIPFGQAEWETFRLIQEMEALIEKDEATQESVDAYVQALKTSTEQGNMYASETLRLLQRNEKLARLQIPVDSTFNRDLSCVTFYKNMPARIERAQYWLDVAVEGGLREESDQVKSAREALKNARDGLGRYMTGSAGETAATNPPPSPLR